MKIKRKVKKCPSRCDPLFSGLISILHLHCAKFFFAFVMCKCFLSSFDIYLHYDSSSFFFGNCFVLL
jgi:hypothetical protein